MARPGFPWKFPYVIEKQAEDHPLGRTLMRPATEARLVGPHGEGSKVFALIDSGSDYTLASPWMAQQVGIDLDAGAETQVKVGGASRTISVVEATLRLCAPAMDAGGHPCDDEHSLTWTAEVGFFRRWEAPPWALILGQIGFFDQFTVVLNRHAQAVAIEPVERFDVLYGDVPASPGISPPDARSY